MIINKPFIEIRGENTYLISKIYDEVNDIEKEIFFTVPNEYGEYLCYEIADCFVVAMLLPAMFSGQNIIVNAPISEMLFYQIENNVTYTLSKVFDKPIIKVFPESTIIPNFNPTAVATGFSGGVDSFTTLLQHLNDVPNSLKISHLTLFNVGSYGNVYEKTQRDFLDDLKRAEEFSKIVKIPLVNISSNFNYFYNDKNNIIYHFAPRLTTSLVSAVLSLQKLFKYYFISSSRTIDKIRFDKPYNQSYYEMLMASFLSNDNCHIQIANGNLNRVEKTKYIVDNNLVKSRLYVCAADIYNNAYSTNFLKDTTPNCSECIKCKQTMITLDLLGKLDEYSNLFDVEKYKKYKKSLYISVLANYKRDDFMKDVYDLMIETNYKIPLNYKLGVLPYKLRYRLARINILRRLYHSLKKNE